MNFNSKTELFSKANGKDPAGMATESRFGQTELNMRASGKIIKHKVKVNFGMLTGTSSMANGLKTKPMDMAFTRMSTAQNTKGNGSKIYSMEMESSSGPMGPSMTEFIMKV